MKENIKKYAAFQGALLGLAILLNILTTEVLGWDNGAGFAGMIFFLVSVEVWWLACRASRESNEPVVAEPKKEMYVPSKYEGVIVWVCFLGFLVAMLIIV